MLVKKVSWDSSDLLTGDLGVVIKELESIKDDYFGLELVTGEVSKVLMINILDSKLTFTFTEDDVFASCELSHENSSNFSYDLTKSLNLLRQHIELFNTYMKLLGENL